VPTTNIRRTGARLPKWNGENPPQFKLRLSRPGLDALKASQGKEMEEAPGSDETLELIKQRSAPAVLILGPGNRLLYANEQAQKIFKDLNKIPAEVRKVCDHIRTSAADAPFASPGMNCEVFRGPGENVYLLRGFPMGETAAGPLQIMVLAEKVTERSAVNLKKAREGFGLSDREIDVVTLLSQGLSNKEISSKLYVSEHTVKDHLKSIARKLGADSRAGIIAILK